MCIEIEQIISGEFKLKCYSGLPARDIMIYERNVKNPPEKMKAEITRDISVD